MTEITFGIYYNEKPEMETTDAKQLIQHFGHILERMHNLLCFHTWFILGVWELRAHEFWQKCRKKWNKHF